MKTFTARTLPFLLFLFLSSVLLAQTKLHLKQVKKNEGPPPTFEDLKINPYEASLPTKVRPFFRLDNFSYRTLPNLVVPKKETRTLKVVYTDRSNIPAAIYGESSLAGEYTEPELKIYAHLESIKEYLQIENPEDEFQIISDQSGKNGYTHYKLQQYHRDVPVYGGELMIHLKNEQIHMVNGRAFPSTKIERVVPSMPQDKASQLAIKEGYKLAHGHHLSDELRKILKLEESKSELVIYHLPAQQNQARLAWRVEVVPNIYHREVYFLDAHTGAILFQQSLLCKAHENPLPPNGPAVGTETDLLGQNRTVNSYEVDGTFALIDASRSMFDANLQFDPGNPAGAIWTLDADDDTPIGNNDFSVAQVLSNNANSWTDASSVSAHFNAGEAYEYFRTTFGRNSIDGQGGSIISIINVADEDGKDLENAFWSGSAMFYGNGGNAFSPLARSLDVAGHEISHGVIQATANLEYLSQSGALNESFADIFGAMIDRNDWKVGEDVVNPNFFPTGALRDLSNPNNGGSGINSNGWQPAHMNEYVNLPETEEGDNGGVHINSGITNRAYFLFATAVGKDIAERVYYNALANYLTRFSQFSDLRIAAIASANELYNTNVANAAATAFDQVGILGDQGGSGGGTNQAVEIDPNTGDQRVLFTDANNQSINLYTYDNRVVAEPFISVNILSKPSISDDGSRMVYVDGDQNIQLVRIDWANNSAEPPFAVTSDGRWRTAAVSKDGRLLAALTNDFDNRIAIIQLSTGQGRFFDLVNPTTAAGISAGTVSYADVLEWSLDGESLMYDALSTISKVDGTIEFWDVGFIRVWNPQTDDFGDGYISKLFTGLPEKISVGNPTFSKNSPFIIALDLIDETDDSYTVIGVDVLTGDVGGIFGNDDLSFPNYSVNDDEIIFDATNNTGNRILGVIGLAEDKINGSGDAFIFISGKSGARWGTVFATGQRALSTATEELILQENGLTTYPNPVRDQLQIELDAPGSETTLIQLFDPLGKRVYTHQESLGAGLQKWTLPLENLASGSYVLDIRQANNRWIKKVVKIK